MKNLILFIQGFLIGVGNVIPGVSGSVLAIIFGLYEKMVASISSIKEFKKNLIFLCILGSGISLAIILGSSLIKFLLSKHYFKTMMFFIGMMTPGLIPLFKNVKNEYITKKNVLICTLVIIALFMISIIKIDSKFIYGINYLQDFIALFFCGIIDAFCTVIPGISGSAILMLIGYYERILSATASVLYLPYIIDNLKVLVPFFTGTGIGIIITSKIVNNLFKNHRTLTYMLIILFALYSHILLITQTISMIHDASTFIIGMIFLTLGMTLTYIIDKKLSK